MYEQLRLRPWSRRIPPGPSRGPAGGSGRWRRRRPVILVRVIATGVLAAGLSCTSGCARPDANPLWQAAPPTPVGSSTPSPGAGRQDITLSATGDIIMGNAPARLPANGGKGFFDAVRDQLSADLAMGNLEEPLTDDTGHSKCDTEGTPTAGATPTPGTAKPTGAAKPSGCHQFRAPAGYAAHLRDAGFMVLNQANNHANDFGVTGRRNTQKALEKYGLRHTGERDEYVVVEVRGLRVAVLGFSPYSWSNSVTSIGAAKKVVARAAGEADLVVVQAHMGAEGSEKTRVRPGTELFLGENRGDPIRFARAVIDAGADLVVGHGPHVLRAMEFYKGRLIAYSLGNFAGGGGTLSTAGRLAWGGVLRVSLRPDGSFGGGQFVSTYMNGSGRPTRDARNRGLDLLDELSGKDFPSTRAVLSDKGAITVPSA